MKNFNFILWPAIALTVAVIMYFAHQLQTKPLPPREKPLAHYYSTQERVELALKIPASNTQFFNVPAANIPSVVCDTTYTRMCVGEDGKPFAIVYYFDDHQEGLFHEFGINTTRVQIFIGDSLNPQYQ